MHDAPLVIRPHSVAKPWGGKHLNPWKQDKSREPIGELVLLSGIKNFSTYVENNGTQQTFQDYWEQKGKKKALHHGSQHENEIFPILLKILSTQEPLSLQVHPSTQDLKKKFNKNDTGKFESWVILDSDENSNIYFGLKEEYSANDLTPEHPNPLALFNNFHPKQGDIFELEPGIIHGTQGSVLFFEIQQPSDYTFRIYDFGRGRKLHLQEAKKVIQKKKVNRNKWSKSFKNKYFSLDIRRAHQIKNYEVKKTYEIFTYFGPSASVVGAFGSLGIEWGSTLLFWSGSFVSFEATSTSLRSATSGLDNTSPIFSELPLMNLNEARFFISSE